MIRKELEEAVVGGRGKSDRGERWKTNGGVEGDGVALEGRGLAGDRDEGDGGDSMHVTGSCRG